MTDSIEVLRNDVLVAVDTFVLAVNKAMLEHVPPVQAAIERLCGSDISDVMKVAILKEAEKRMDAIDAGLPGAQS